jgi:hypothetical protein
MPVTKIPILTVHKPEVFSIEEYKIISKLLRDARPRFNVLYTFDYGRSKAWDPEKAHKDISKLNKVFQSTEGVTDYLMYKDLRLNMGYHIHAFARVSLVKGESFVDTNNRIHRNLRGSWRKILLARNSRLKPNCHSSVAWKDLVYGMPIPNVLSYIKKGVKHDPEDLDLSKFSNLAGLEKSRYFGELSGEPYILDVPSLPNLNLDIGTCLRLRFCDGFSISSAQKYLKEISKFLLFSQVYVAFVGSNTIEIYLPWALDSSLKLLRAFCQNKYDLDELYLTNIRFSPEALEEPNYSEIFLHSRFTNFAVAQAGELLYAFSKKTYKEDLPFSSFIGQCNRVKRVSLPSTRQLSTNKIVAMVVDLVPSQAFAITLPTNNLKEGESIGRTIRLAHLGRRKACIFYLRKRNGKLYLEGLTNAGRYLRGWCKEAEAIKFRKVNTRHDAVASVVVAGLPDGVERADWAWSTFMVG